MLFENIKEIRVSVSNSDKIFVQFPSSSVKKFTIKKEFKIYCENRNKVRFLGRVYKLPIRMASPGEIVVNGNIYPGEIKLLSSSKRRLRVINIVGLEDYLCGVLPYEIEPVWSDEMLKVQSIISRTYTMSNLGRHKKEGYDFCSTMHCQVYRGISKRYHSRIKRIVDSTKGLVICDKNSVPILAYYHSCCGGGIEDVNALWPMGRKISYLGSKRCEYCKSSPYYNWEIEIYKEKLEKLFYKKGYNIGSIIKINIISQTSLGSVKQLSISGTKNTIMLSGDELRSIIGWNILKSTKIKKIKFEKEKIIFSGSGWGHRVGLCQWGANYMTESGKKFYDVIKYYYPGTKIKKL